MALTSRTSIKRSYPSPCGRTFRLSQVFRHTPCDHLRVVPLDRIRTFPVRRTGRLGYTPVLSPFTEWNAAFGWKCDVHPIQYSRLFLTDWLSSGRVTLNDPSNRTSSRNPGDLWLADRLAQRALRRRPHSLGSYFTPECSLRSYAHSHRTSGGKSESYRCFHRFGQCVSKGACRTCIEPFNEGSVEDRPSSRGLQESVGVFERPQRHFPRDLDDAFVLRSLDHRGDTQP